MGNRPPQNKPGIAEDLFRYAMMSRLSKVRKFQDHKEDYLWIIGRYLDFYGMELLSFLGSQDVERFISYERRIIPLYYLPFREHYTREGEWILSEFTEHVSDELTMVETQPAVRYRRPEGFAPLSEDQIDQLFTNLAENTSPSVMVKFALGTGIPTRAIAALTLHDLDMYRGIVKAHTYPWPTRYYGLGARLRYDLLIYLEALRTETRRESEVFIPPPPLSGQRDWPQIVVADTLATLGIDPLYAYGRLLATHFDQREKAGGSFGAIGEYQTELAFRHRKGLREDERRHEFVPSVSNAMSGYISLYEPNEIVQVASAQNIRSVMDHNEVGTKHHDMSGLEKPHNGI